jgi:hypothetical protein
VRSGISVSIKVRSPASCPTATSACGRRQPLEPRGHALGSLIDRGKVAADQIVETGGDQVAVGQRVAAPDLLDLVGEAPKLELVADHVELEPTVGVEGLARDRRQAVDSCETPQLVGVAALLREIRPAMIVGVLAKRRGADGRRGEVPVQEFLGQRLELLRGRLRPADRDVGHRRWIIGRRELDLRSTSEQRRDEREPADGHDGPPHAVTISGGRWLVSL